MLEIPDLPQGFLVVVGILTTTLELTVAVTVDVLLWFWLTTVFELTAACFLTNEKRTLGKTIVLRVFGIRLPVVDMMRILYLLNCVQTSTSTYRSMQI